MKSTKDPFINWFYQIRNCIFEKNYKEVLFIYTRNRSSGTIVLSALPLVLKACTSLVMISLGKALHCEAIKGGVEVDVMVGTGLINMYGKCGDIFNSRKVFEFMPVRTVVTWNAMTGVYMSNGDIISGRLLFDNMSTRTSVTWNEMIDGYAKKGDLITARHFFNRVPKDIMNVITWTVMVDGYARNGDMERALEVFEEMTERNFYVWSSIISGYFRNGEVEKAEIIFNKMESRNLVNWNSLISGYTQNGLFKKALYEFKRMQIEGFEPDEVTFVSVLTSCTQLGLLAYGKQVHDIIIIKGVNLNCYILNCLIDMYAKCGVLNTARLIFNRTVNKNNAAWNAIISGYAKHGQCEEALKLFYLMEGKNEKPDDITFLAILTACAHGGLVNEGLKTFTKIEKYGGKASIRHYGCLVDILGRAGRLKEAFELVKSMPMKPNEIIYGSLLGACRIYNDLNMVDEVLLEIERENCENVLYDGEYCVLLSNIYKACERWEKVQGIRVSRKTYGCSVVVS